MALSSCGKCENRFFEVKENSPRGSRFKLLFVQCSKCGTPIGVLDYTNIGARLSEVEKDLKKEIRGLKSDIDTVNLNVGGVITMIKKLLRQ